MYTLFLSKRLDVSSQDGVEEVKTQGDGAVPVSSFSSTSFVVLPHVWPVLSMWRNASVSLYIFFPVGVPQECGPATSCIQIFDLFE
jgi:hypothetical protein